MVFVAVDNSSSLHAESNISKELDEDRDYTPSSICESPLESSHEEHTPAEQGTCHKEIAGSETLDKGYLNYGYGF